MFLQPSSMTCIQKKTLHLINSSNPLAIYFVYDSCEENYAHSEFIAEWWGMISSLLFVFIGGVGCWYSSLKNCYISLIVVGIASVFNHAALSPFSQFCDEIAIICAELAYASEADIKISRQFLWLLFIMCILGMYNPIPLAIVMVLLFQKIISRIILMKKRFKQLHYISSATIGCFILSICFGLLDYSTCPHLQHVHFHALWHITVAIFCLLGACSIEHYKNKFC